MRQNLLIGLFKTITKEEWKEVLQREVEEFCNENGNQDDSILPKNVEKHFVWCTPKFLSRLKLSLSIET
jgi:hypothetical protein